MTDKILLPSTWNNLSDEDKELAKKLTKSILRGKESTQLLLQLLSSEGIDDELREEVKKISNHKLDFDVITFHKKDEDRKFLMSIVEEKTSGLEFNDTVFNAVKGECEDVCSNANTEEEKTACKKCRKIFG